MDNQTGKRTDKRVETVVIKHLQVSGISQNRDRGCFRGPYNQSVLGCIWGSGSLFIENGYRTVTRHHPKWWWVHVVYVDNSFKIWSCHSLPTFEGLR